MTIVGRGILEEELKSIAKSNIKFIGFINNEEIGEIYQEHDVFVLPSTNEAWGLVVDEAIYWGLPIVVSNKVGASIDMVREPRTGEIFDVDNIDSFNQAIYNVESNYDFYKQNVLSYSFEERDRKQVDAYIKLLDN